MLSLFLLSITFHICLTKFCKEIPQLNFKFLLYRFYLANKIGICLLHCISMEPSPELVLKRYQLDLWLSQISYHFWSKYAQFLSIQKYFHCELSLVQLGVRQYHYLYSLFRKLTDRDSLDMMLELYFLQFQMLSFGRCYNLNQLQAYLVDLMIAESHECLCNFQLRINDHFKH